MSAQSALVVDARGSRNAWLLGALLLVVFMAATVDPMFIAADPTARGTLRAGLESQETGLLGRRIALTLLALLALIVNALDRPRGIRITGATGFFMASALAWFCLTLVWAADPHLAARKIAVLACMWSGALWAAAWIPPRRLAAVVLLSVASVVAACVTLDILTTGFAFFSFDYRFAGLFHPNDTGRYLAVGVLANVVILSRASGLRRFSAYVLLLLFLLLLVKTGSRTSLVTLIAGVSATLFLFALRSKRVRLGLGLWAVFTIAFLVAVVVVGGQVGHLAKSAVQMGRGAEDLSHLTGRVPAWRALLFVYVPRHPLIGYGYNAFWTPDHMVSMSYVLPGATYFHAHSGYLDLVLSVGVIGALLFVASVTGALLVHSIRYVRSGDVGFAFMAALLVMLLTGMLTESMNFEVSLPGLYTLVALANAAFVTRYRIPAGLARR